MVLLGYITDSLMRVRGKEDSGQWSVISDRVVGFGARNKGQGAGRTEKEKKGK
jgi:hypothetical protein